MNLYASLSESHIGSLTEKELLNSFYLSCRQPLGVRSHLVHDTSP